MKSFSLLRIAFIMSFSILLTSCDKDNSAGQIVDDPQLLGNLYSNSVDTLTFQGNKYILEINLNRDFMPGGPIPKKSPLIADIYLVNLDSLPIMTNLEIKKLYLIQNNLIWISTPSNGVQPYIPDFKLNKLSRNGPEWTPNTYVDAVILIVNKLTLDDYFLITRHQNINRTD